jgi:hypothetical protein
MRIVAFGRVPHANHAVAERERCRGPNAQMAVAQSGEENRAVEDKMFTFIHESGKTCGFSTLILIGCFNQENE